MDAALETRNLHKTFGALVATNDVSFRLERGARHALIGPNGAGKTTFINLLTGVLPVTSGRILMDGADITAERRDRRVRRGLVRTFQINQLFADMTPAQSLGLTISQRSGRGGGWLQPLTGSSKIREEIADLAISFGIADVLDVRSGDLAYGKQRLLEIALAIAAGPRVLLLDEPAAGVPEAERRDILARIARLPADVSVLLIEHDMDLVFSFADRISVLVNGALFAAGTVDEIARDPRVQDVYLGHGAHE